MSETNETTHRDRDRETFRPELELERLLENLPPARGEWQGRLRDVCRDWVSMVAGQLYSEGELRSHGELTEERRAAWASASLIVAEVCGRLEALLLAEQLEWQPVARARNRVGERIEAFDVFGPLAIGGALGQLHSALHALQWDMKQDEKRERDAAEVIGRVLDHDPKEPRRVWGPEHARRYPSLAQDREDVAAVLRAELTSKGRIGAEVLGRWVDEHPGLDHALDVLRELEPAGGWRFSTRTGPLMNSPMLPQEVRAYREAHGGALPDGIAMWWVSRYNLAEQAALALDPIHQGLVASACAKPPGPLPELAMRVHDEIIVDRPGRSTKRLRHHFDQLTKRLRHHFDGALPPRFDDESPTGRTLQPWEPALHTIPINPSGPAYMRGRSLDAESRADEIVLLVHEPDGCRVLVMDTPTMTLPGVAGRWPGEHVDCDDALVRLRELGYELDGTASEAAAALRWLGGYVLLHSTAKAIGVSVYRVPIQLVHRAQGPDPKLTKWVPLDEVCKSSHEPVAIAASFIRDRLVESHEALYGVRHHEALYGVRHLRHRVRSYGGSSLLELEVLDACKRWVGATQPALLRLLATGLDVSGNPGCYPHVTARANELRKLVSEVDTRLIGLLGHGESGMRTYQVEATAHVLHTRPRLRDSSDAAVDAADDVISHAVDDLREALVIAMTSERERLATERRAFRVGWEADVEHAISSWLADSGAIDKRVVKVNEFVDAVSAELLTITAMVGIDSFTVTVAGRLSSVLNRLSNMATLLDYERDDHFAYTAASRAAWRCRDYLVIAHKRVSP